MKKKLMMVAALIGAISLGACVDDNESASVTEVRNAKAAQLNALAKKFEAQAEAAKITAEAEAAYQKALARLQEAQAAGVEAENKKAEAIFEAEVAKAKAEAEEAMWRAKKEAMEAEKAILEAADYKLTALYNAYTTAAEDLTDLKKSKANAEYSLANAKSGLADKEVYIAQKTAEYEADIKAYEAEIAAWKAYTGMDLDALKKELLELQNQKYPLFKALEEAKKVTEDAEKAVLKVLDPYFAGGLDGVQRETEYSSVAAVAEVEKFMEYNYLRNDFYLFSGWSFGNSSDYLAANQAAWNKALEINSNAYYAKLVPEVGRIIARAWGNNGTEYYYNYSDLPDDKMAQFECQFFDDVEVMTIQIGGYNYPCMPINVTDVEISEKYEDATVPQYSLSVNSIEKLDDYFANLSKNYIDMKGDLEEENKKIEAEIAELTERYKAYYDKQATVQKRVDELQAQIDAFDAEIAKNKSEQDAFNVELKNLFTDKNVANAAKQTAQTQYAAAEGKKTTAEADKATAVANKTAAEAILADAAATPEDKAQAQKDLDAAKAEIAKADALIAEATAAMKAAEDAEKAQDEVIKGLDEKLAAVNEKQAGLVAAENELYAKKQIIETEKNTVETELNNLNWFIASFDAKVETDKFTIKVNEGRIENWQKYIDEEAEITANWQALKAALNADYEAEVKALAANQVVLDCIAAIEAEEAAQKEYDELDGKIQAASAFINSNEGTNIVDVDAKISELEEYILAKKAAIAQLKEGRSYWNDANGNGVEDPGERVYVDGSDFYNKEIARLEAEIADLEAQIDVQTKIVDQRKAALEAAMEEI